MLQCSVKVFVAGDIRTGLWWPDDLRGHQDKKHAQASYTTMLYYPCAGKGKENLIRASIMAHLA